MKLRLKLLLPLLIGPAVTLAASDVLTYLGSSTRAHNISLTVGVD